MSENVRQRQRQRQRKHYQIFEKLDVTSLSKEYGFTKRSVSLFCHCKYIKEFCRLF